jgi:hypothetical protein
VILGRKTEGRAIKLYDSRFICPPQTSGEECECYR